MTGNYDSLVVTGLMLQRIHFHTLKLLHQVLRLFGLLQYAQGDGNSLLQRPEKTFPTENGHSE